MLANVEVIGAVRIHRTASSDRRGRGRLLGWARLTSALLARGLSEQQK